MKIAPREPNFLPLVSTTGIFIFPSRLQTRGPRFDPWVEKVPLEKGMGTHSSIAAWRNHMDRGARRATVQGVAKSRARLSDEHKDVHRSIILRAEERRRLKCPPHSWRADQGNAYPHTGTLLGDDNRRATDSRALWRNSPAFSQPIFCIGAPIYNRPRAQHRLKQSSGHSAFLPILGTVKCLSFQNLVSS